MKAEDYAPHAAAPGDDSNGRVSDNPPPGGKASNVLKPEVPKTNARRMPMVGWYDPRQLFKTGIEVAISTVFGRHSDYRIVEALSSGPPEVYDYTFHYRDDLKDTCEPDPARPRDSIWIDYVGDVGDGWNPTYAVAYHLSRPEHTFKYGDPEGGGRIRGAYEEGRHPRLRR